MSPLEGGRPLILPKAELVTQRFGGSNDGRLSALNASKECDNSQAISLSSLYVAGRFTWSIFA
jgi:hypothetical protein